MAKLNFAFVCESATISEETGSANFSGVFTGIVAKALPYLRKQFSVVLNFLPEDTKKHIVNIKIKTPSGKNFITPKEKEVISDRPTPDEAIGYILNILNIEFKEEGLYIVEFYVDNKLIHKYYFRFSILK